MTSITGRRTTQKCKKCDWSVKGDLATKIVYIIPKNDKFDIYSRKKNMLFEDYY